VSQKGSLWYMDTKCSSDDNANKNPLANGKDYRGLHKLAGEKWNISPQLEPNKLAKPTSHAHADIYGAFLRGCWAGHEFGHGRKDPLLDHLPQLAQLGFAGLNLPIADAKLPAQAIPLPSLDTGAEEESAVKKMAEAMVNPWPTKQKPKHKRPTIWEAPPCKRLFIIPIGTPEEIERLCAQADDALRKFFKEKRITVEVSDADVAAAPYAKEISQIRPSLAKRYLQLLMSFGNGDLTEEELLNYLEAIPVMPPHCVRKALHRVIWWRQAN